MVANGQHPKRKGPLKLNISLPWPHDNHIPHSPGAIQAPSAHQFYVSDKNGQVTTLQQIMTNHALNRIIQASLSWNVPGQF